jgi:prefoldin subunit 5
MEINRKITNYEQNILILNREREDLHRKKMDYETKITMLTSEIERLNMLIRTRTEELQRALQETESYRQHSERKILTN